MPDVQLRLHNTLTRTKEVFEPIDPERVRLYLCGPTVYQRIHVGNARAFIAFDVLYRLLRHLYGADHVVYVRNITDIDDKIMDQARAEGIGIGELTDRTTALFQADLAALGCLPPTHEPRATEYVPGMIALIATLIERGHAYPAEGHVLFSVPSMPTYGRLSRRNRDEQIAGARIDVAPYKRDPADFVLWKPSTGDQPGWDSPWSYGRPGWHIECSAMSEQLLGPLPFDIHGGGLDLIFPHHENEIAQSCCAHGIDTMARFWLHNGFLDMRGEKMSKSLGNVVRVPEALETAPAEAIRLYLLSTHYRQPADFKEEGLLEAKRTLDRLYGVLDRVPPLAGLPAPAITEALAEDLNTPRALAILHDLLNQVNRNEDPRTSAILRASAQIVGILNADPKMWRQDPMFSGTQETTASATFYVPDSDIEIQALLRLRNEARDARDFVRADGLRQELEKLGVIVEDHLDGTTWRRA